MSPHSHSHHHLFDILLALVLLAGLFAPLLVLNSHSLAATYSHNPYGSADSCAYVNGKTIIYGWAYEPDTTAVLYPYVTISAGSASGKVSSALANYRDSYVNSYVASHNPGAPTNSNYGWSWSVNGLTQGTSYTVTGTVLNYGSGSDAAMMVNTSRFSGMASNNYPFSGTHTIPDACLAPKPASAPAPAPAPAPVPTTSTTTKKTTTSTSSTATTTSTAPAPAAPTANEITTTVGTTTAVISLPTGGASAVTVAYAPDPQALTQTASAPDVSGTTATITLHDLQPKTTYDYTVSRTANGQTGTSSTASFTTKGYEIKAQFLKGNDTPVSGIQGTIGTTKATSDKQGFMTFTDMEAGNHTLVFTYGGKSYRQTVSTSDASGSDGQVLKAQPVIDLTHYADTAHLTSGHTSIVALVVAGIAVALGLGVFVAWTVLRRKMRPLPRPASPFGDPLASRPPAAPLTSSEPLPSHAGQSLATMVMEAMQQEKQRAAQRENQPDDSTDLDSPGATPPSVPPPMMPPSQR